MRLTSRSPRRIDHAPRPARWRAHAARAALAALLAWLVGADATPAARAQAPAEGYRQVDAWSSRGAASSVPRLERPLGIDVAADDTLFVADNATSRIHHLTARGDTIASWAPEAATGKPLDVAADGGRLFVLGDRGGEVRDRSGRVLAPFDADGGRGIAAAAGRFYVVRREGGGGSARAVIDVRAASGALEATWTDLGLTIGDPWGIDVAADGTLYLAGDGAVYVLRPDADGASVVDLLRVARGQEGPPLLDVAVDASGRVFANQARRLVAWRVQGSPAYVGDWAFEGASRLAVGPGGGLVVTTFERNAFIGLSYFPDRGDLTGTPLRWGDADQTLGQLEAPRRVATSGTGDVFVLDRLDRVQRWSAAGDPLEQWPRPSLGDVSGGGDAPCVVRETDVACLGPGQTVRWEITPSGTGWPTAIDGNAQRVAVVDLADQVLWLYARDGAPAGSHPLGAPGGFRSIADVAVDGDLLYLADRGARRVEVRDRDFTLLRTIEVPGDAVRVAAADGALYALSREGWLWKYTSGGTLRAVWRPAPDGSPSDVAVGANGRVYVTDTATDQILVYEPGGPPGSVPPSAEENCVLTTGKRAAPQSVELGETVSVRLTVTGACPRGDGRLDVVMVLDQSGSMIGPPLAAAKAAALSFLSDLDPAGAQVSVVGFSTSAEVLQGLTGDLRDVVRAVARLRAAGQTNYVEALDAAYAEVTSPSARPGVPRVVVMMTDGKPTDDSGVVAAADRLKSAGVTLYTIGLGTNLDPDLLRRIASEPGLFFEAPTETELADIYTAIARRISSQRILRTGIVRDELPPDMQLVPGSVEPPAVQTGRVLRWDLADTPPTGTVLRYDVVPQRAGLRPTNVFATLDFVDALGVSGQLSFPVPEVEVRQRSRWDAYLPVTYRNQCKPQRADVVLVFDTSSSMTVPVRDGSTETRLDAAVAAGRAFLDGMTLPGDQVAIVSFNERAETVLPLTGARAPAQFALAGLAAGSGTRIDRGLEQAFVELLGPRRIARNNPVIILMTDGHPQPGSEAAVLSAARQVRAAGFEVFTIGLGSVDRVLLSLIATAPGNSRFAPDASQLRSIYDQIAGQVLCE